MDSNDTNLLEPLVNIRESVDNNITKIKCLPDAGSQVTIAGRKQMKEINIKKKKHLTEPSRTLKHAGGNT